MSSTPARPAPRRPGGDRQEHDGRRARRPDRRRRRRPALPDARRWSASTWCCPTSPTCASARSDIEAIVVTHGHEDHLGALPWVLRELGERATLPPVYGGALTIAMARSKLDEHKLRDVELNEVDAGRDARAGAVLAGAGAHDPLDPRLERRRARHRARHGADHRRLQVRPDARRRRAGGRLAPGGARARGRAAAVRRLDERRPSRASRRRSRSSARTWRRCSRAARGGSW